METKKFDLNDAKQIVLAKYMEKAEKPNFGLWQPLPSWSLMQGIQLLYGFEPGALPDDYFEDFYFPSEYPEQIQEMYQTYIKATKDLLAEKLEGSKKAIRTEDFIKWASKNGISIPKELETPSKEIDDFADVIELLKEFKPDIEKFFNSFKADFNNLKAEELQATAEYISNTNKYDKLESRHITDSRLYDERWKNDEADFTHLPRDIKGRLCQIIISDRLRSRVPNPLNPPEGFGLKKIYKLYREI